VPASVPVPGLNDSQSPADIDSNSLNVTRVGGMVAFIAAILAGVSQLFPVSKSDPTALRIAIPAIEGTIVVGALLAAALIISADIRGRALAAASALPLPAGKLAAAASAAGPGAAAPALVASPPVSPAPSAASLLQSYKVAISAAANEFDAMDPNDPTVVGGLAKTLATISAPPGKQVQHNQVETLAENLEERVTAATNLPADQRDAALGALREPIAQLKTSLATLGS
jgi:hypothetical protein